MRLNSSLIGGSGVDGAIHAAGGRQILEECKSIVRKIGVLKTGELVITSGGKLKAKYVIHTVGPIWNGGCKNEETLLANAYRNSLKLASEKGIKTIAFPSISTGVYGFPKELATKIAFDTVIDYLINFKNIEEVRFICLDGYTYKLYVDLLNNDMKGNIKPLVKIENYKGDNTMSTIEELLKMLKERCDNQSIKITSGINFEYNEASKTLHLQMKKGIKENMQQDNAAFEAWALAFKANLDDYVDKVTLGWDKIDEPTEKTKAEWRHFNRFLYRVNHFITQYEWFSLGYNNVKDPWHEQIKMEAWTKFVLNEPGNRLFDKLIEGLEIKSEHQIEEYFKGKGSHKLQEKIKVYGIEINKIYSQYPVGVFNEKVAKKNIIFTGGKSAIDLYGVDDKNKSFNIFELKAGGNVKIGIVSELFFYASVIKDTINGSINWEEPQEMKVSKVNAFFLVPKMHPLVTDAVITLLNNPDNVINYRKLIYSVDDINIK